MRLKEEHDGFKRVSANFPDIPAVAMHYTSVLHLLYLLTGTHFSVISAKAKAAERCRSTLSLYERMLRERRGSPAKKLVSVRSTDETHSNQHQFSYRNLPHICDKRGIRPGRQQAFERVD